MQIVHKFNSRNSKIQKSKAQFDVNATIDEKRHELRAHVQYLGMNQNGSSMANMIIKLPSGLAVKESSLNELKRTGQIGMYESFEQASHLVLYFETIGKKLTTINLKLDESANHRVDNRQNGLIAVFDYYESIGKLAFLGYCCQYFL